MAFENRGATLVGAEAAGDLSAEQFKIVVLDSNAQMAVAGAGVLAAGVLQNKPSAIDRAATVWGPGSISKVIAGAAVAQGADVTSDSTGRAITPSAGDFILGQALTAAANANELISVWITQPGREPV